MLDYFVSYGFLPGWSRMAESIVKVENCFLSDQVKVDSIPDNLGLCGGNRRRSPIENHLRVSGGAWD